MAATSLTPKQRLAIAALIEHGAVAAAAREVDVSRNTLNGWLKQPAFRQALRDAEVELMRELSRHLASQGRKAIAAIDGVLSDPEANAYLRLRAAELVLTKLLTIREHVDLEAQIVELREALEKHKAYARA